MDVLSGKSTLGNRSVWYYWGKNPDPKVGLHAVRMMTREFGNWKLHWVTQGSHCNPSYPDKVRLMMIVTFLLRNKESHA